MLIKNFKLFDLNTLHCIYTNFYRLIKLIISLAARFQGAEEIAYFELNTEEKVAMILKQSVAIILAKQQN